MNFGVIGPGDIGAVIVQKLRDVSYPVKMANSRGPESLKDLAAKTGAIPMEGLTMVGVDSIQWRTPWKRHTPSKEPNPARRM